MSPLAGRELDFLRRVRLGVCPWPSRAPKGLKKARYVGTCVIQGFVEVGGLVWGLKVA
jgi:hypothetical protein